MPGSVGLNVPSYLPTLFAPVPRGNSLLATLDGRNGVAGGPVAATGPAPPDEASNGLEMDAQGKANSGETV